MTSNFNNMNLRVLKILENLIRQLIPALLEGDEQEISKYNLTPRGRTTFVLRKGGNNVESVLHLTLKDAHRKGEWIPKITLLPNVGQFQIKLRTYNAALLANGIVSRYGSEITLFEGRNRRMNRYLLYSYWRLFKNKGNPTKFWSIATNLIRSSHVYLAACLHSIDRNVYREKNMVELKLLLKRINQLRNNFHLKETGFKSHRNPLLAMRHYIKFFRVYIPKNENEVRPLGVPTLAWRVFLKMWLIPVMGFTGDFCPPYFHGYIPNRGTATAWKTILKEVIHSGNIYELDFKGFFPSIPTNNLTAFLYDKGSIPLSVCVFIHLMNNSTPIWVGKDELEEVHFQRSHLHSLVLDQLKLILLRPKVKERSLKDVSTTGLREPTSELIPGSWTDKNRPYDILKPRIVKGIVPYELDGKGKDSMVIGELERGLQVNWKDNPLVNKELQVENPIPTHNFDPNYQVLKWKGSKGIPLQRKLTPKEEMEMAKALQSWFKLPSNPSFQLGSLKTPMEIRGGHIVGTDIPQSSGLPQGGGLSPYLSILYLEWVLREIGIPASVKLLFYADDGLFYSDNQPALEEWIRKLQGPSHLKTSLSYYGITFALNKCMWVKRHGVWLNSLKFLGMRFIPGLKIATSILKAETRGKLKLTPEGLTIKKSNMVFNRQYLVFYTYSMNLLSEGLEYLTSKVQGRGSSHIIHYYEMLRGIAEYKLPRRAIDYMYLVFTIITNSVSLFVLFFASGMQNLNSYKSVDIIAKSLLIGGDQPAQREIMLSDLNIESKEMVFQAVAWLKGGYDSGIMQPHASSKLLTALEHSFTVGAVPNVILPSSRLEDVLRELMQASLRFFGYNKINPTKEESGIVNRQIGNERFKSVPLDFMRFLYNSFLPYVYLLVDYSNTWIAVTQSDKQSTEDVGLYSNYKNRKFFYKLKALVYQNQFRNLANSEFFGLLQSRLYAGSWRCEDIVQNFNFTYKKGSLAEYLKVRSKSISIFNGSSYAFHEIVRLGSQLKTNSRGKVPFQLFSQGESAHDSWSDIGY